MLTCALVFSSVCLSLPYCTSLSAAAHPSSCMSLCICFALSVWGSLIIIPSPFTTLAAVIESDARQTCACACVLDVVTRGLLSLLSGVVGQRCHGYLQPRLLVEGERANVPSQTMVLSQCSSRRGVSEERVLAATSRPAVAAPLRNAMPLMP